MIGTVDVDELPPVARVPVLPPTDPTLPPLPPADTTLPPTVPTSFRQAPDNIADPRMSLEIHLDSQVGR